MREHIISEIRRLAAIDGGRAPGNKAFTSATGIIESKWRGKYWARWGDALVEAGFEPNEWTGKSDPTAILDGIITACRHFGRFPTESEIAILRTSDPSIPSPKTVRDNFKGREKLVAALINHISNDSRYDDVRPMLPKAASLRRVTVTGSKPVDGHVYLIRSGDYYKVGRSDELERRVKEIRIALPDAATLIHAITTDDPPGIEAYWHRRFAGRRANGEWFKLAPEDVKAFLRRKFQ